MAYRQSGGPSRRSDHGGDHAYPTRAGSYLETPDKHHEVPYYQDPRDMGSQQYYDTYAFSNPNSYSDWVGNGQPLRAAAASSMPRPRAAFYRPPATQYSSFSTAGPSHYSNGSFHAGPSNGYDTRTYSSYAPGPAPPRGSYVPPHKRGDTRSPPPGQAGSSTPLRDTRPPPAPFVIPLPDRDYMNLSKPHIPSAKARTVAEAPKKLLVLDLNGTLIFRNKSSSNSRTAYPRPYLKSFLEYLLQKEEEGNVDGLGRWSVFVWSSAQPHNVRGMLESTFDPKHINGLWDMEGPDKMASAFVKGKVLGVWSRDKMGLSKEEYAKKTQTVKDLRNVAEHFMTLEHQTKSRFRLQDILLLDDSPKKAVHQPWNQLVLPEYDKAAWQQSREAVSRSRTGEPGPECDQYLLAIIGILEDLNTVSNIPAYIRAGGLKKPSASDYATEWAPSGRWQGIADGPQADEPPRLNLLPTDPAFVHWFQDSAVVEKWIERGKEALEKRKIPLEHGVRTDISGSQSPAPFSSNSTRRTSRAPTPGHTVPPQRRRGYSPSQPTQTNADQVEDQELAGRARSLSFDNESVRPIHPARAKSPLSLDQRAPPPIRPASGQTRRFSTSNPNPNIQFAPISETFDPSRPVDTWRTLRSADVSRWLADIADRASSLDQQARTLLLHAGDILRTMGTDGTWDRRMPEELLRLGGWREEMTDGELERAGQLRAWYLTKDKVAEAKANGMPPCESWISKGSWKFRMTQNKVKRDIDRATDPEFPPVFDHQTSTHIFSAINSGKSVDEVVKHAPGLPLTSNGHSDQHVRPAVENLDPSTTPRGPALETNDEPLDYLSSSLDLSPCVIDGVALNGADVARLVQQAGRSNMPKQIKRFTALQLCVTRMTEGNLVGKAAEKCLRTIQTTRDALLRSEHGVNASLATQPRSATASDDRRRLAKAVPGDTNLFPPCQVRGQSLDETEARRMFKVAQSGPTTDQKRLLADFYAAENRIQHGGSSYDGREGDIAQLGQIRESIIQIQAEKEREHAVATMRKIHTKTKAKPKKQKRKQSTQSGPNEPGTKKARKH